MAGKSLAEKVALLSDEERAEVFKDYTEKDFNNLQYDANFWLRPAQIIKDGDAFITALVAGRGFGKTLTMSQWIRRKALENPGCRLIIAARSSADYRDVCVLGESGILAVHHPDERPIFKPSSRSIIWPNGSQAILLSSEAPDQARGVQAHFSALDEYATYSETKDSAGNSFVNNIIAATRLGDSPELLYATTPKRTPGMKKLMEDAKNPKNKIKVIRGSTFDNTSLSKTYIENLVNSYGNGDLAKQELEGLMIDDASGILWDQALIDSSRHTGFVPNLPLRIVAVDPSVSANKDGDNSSPDECGIIVTYASVEADLTKRKAYIVEDASIKAGPEVWAQRVSDVAKAHNTRWIVVERNAGGDLLRLALNAVDPTLKVLTVFASKGKAKRAEPVVTAFHQGRVKMVTYSPALEDEMVMFDPDMKNNKDDRMDAMTWSVIATIIDPPDGLYSGSLRATGNASARKLPQGIKTGRTRVTGSIRRR